MPRPRFDRLADDKRQRILAVAAEEFATHGFAGASLNRIIEQAGISKGAAYYYFDDKADLFGTVLRYGMEAFRPAPGAALDLARLDRTSFWPAVLRSYQSLLDAIRRQPWLTALGKMFYGPPPSATLGSLVEEQLTLARDWLGQLVIRGQQLGTIRTDLPGDLLLTVLAAAGEAADRWFVANRERLDPDEADAVALVLFDALRRMAEPSAAPLKAATPQSQDPERQRRRRVGVGPHAK
ncbi:MAG: TetR/AcrR family transcriptional regulator [Acidobacteriota bacterium]|nr:TetR/AcrR family transcriptional regulator [Acidobacteriota bacterium]